MRTFGLFCAYDIYFVWYARHLLLNTITACDILTRNVYFWHPQHISATKLSSSGVYQSTAIFSFAPIDACQFNNLLHNNNNNVFAQITQNIFHWYLRQNHSTTIIYNDNNKWYSWYMNMEPGGFKFSLNTNTIINSVYIYEWSF